ncbi:MAG TPA: hypothetical protein VD908_21255 [Cytophagales bacterium]|nr:hypothetical protein [Cytophagales bacterium]
MMNYNLILILLSAALVFSSCKEDEPAPHNEEELITNVELHFAEANNEANSFTVTYKDTDGAGGQDPVQSAPIVLEKSKSYLLSIKVKDESNASNVLDLTNEVAEESINHQFFFTFSPSQLATHTYSDEDGNAKPIGLENVISAGSTSISGTMTITLKHQPDKNASGVSSGDISNAGGETDIEARFSISVN